MWAGFWVNAVSGVLLLIAYPTKALTNPLFYGKLVLIAAGLVLARALRAGCRASAAARRTLPPPARALAIASLVVLGRQHHRRPPAGLHLLAPHRRSRGMSLDAVAPRPRSDAAHHAAGRWVRHSQWAWQVLESLHFIGMSVLIGTIGLFDLRLLGFARGIPYAALHRLIPLGIAGYTLNLADRASASSRGRRISTCSTPRSG